MSSSPQGRRPSARNHLERVKAAPGLSAVRESIGPEPAVPYEIRLTRNPGWALSEGSQHFEEKSAVFAALQKITKRLDCLGIPYAVAGGMALFQYGLRRFTEDVDLLVTRGDLKKIHEKLGGLGYLPPHKHSKHLRDTELGVRIEFLTSGEYPGDGKEKPVAFPEPGPVSIEKGGVKYLNLPTLIELKLASGMTNPGRLKDLSDVLELIKLLNLPANFSEQLNPYVREKYAELWGQGKKRFVTLWRNKWLTADARSIEEMIASLRQAAETLEAMRRDGVILEDVGVGDDYAHLTTTDPEVAKKYDMVEESEFWSEDEDEYDEDEPGIAEADDVSEPG
ncbi:MAG TPA: hypothetical protein VJY33_10900 [Isosphaeraceae bacterium]|nr:hypothetical protein [Isosphaeraceae bacterium]